MVNGETHVKGCSALKYGRLREIWSGMGKNGKKAREVRVCNTWSPNDYGQEWKYMDGMDHGQWVCVRQVLWSMYGYECKSQCMRGKNGKTEMKRFREDLGQWL